MQETPQQYRQRMLSYIEGRDPLKLLAAAPQRLERLFKGLAVIAQETCNCEGRIVRVLMPFHFQFMNHVH